MKVWQLIQILCRQDPETEVYLSQYGYPILEKDTFQADRVYNGGIFDDKGREVVPVVKSVVLTTSGDGYDRLQRRVRAAKKRKA